MWSIILQCHRSNHLLFWLFGWLVGSWQLVWQVYSQAFSFLDYFFFSNHKLWSIKFFFSSRFGRRPVILASFMLILVGMVGVAFGPQNAFGFKLSFILYAISRFLIACGTRGINESGYVLALEFVGQSKRSKAAIIFEHFFSVGQLLLVLLAYFLRDWRCLAFAIMLLTVPFLGYFW